LLENNIEINTVFDYDLENHIEGSYNGLDSRDSYSPRGSAPVQRDSSETDALNYGFIPLESDDIYQGLDSCCEPHSLWGRKTTLLYDIHNFSHYNVPVGSGVNIEKFRELAAGYWDQQVFNLLAYGFPLDMGREFIPTIASKNHSSANKYPTDIQKYIDKEVAAGVLCPVDENITPVLHISPLMSRPKEGSSRWVIVDLSWPKGQYNSVNSCVLTDT
jgi:hypothetical protein